MADDSLKEDEIGTGEETGLEKNISNYTAIVIHLFLSLLAVLLLLTAAVGTFDTMTRDFPKLWQPPQDQYNVLITIIENLLLVAITAEFGLLLLFRRLSAAVEVVVFVLARKTVNPDVTAYELLLCAVGIAGLVIVRFYYLPGRTT